MQTHCYYKRWLWLVPFVQAAVIATIVIAVAVGLLFLA